MKRTKAGRAEGLKMHRGCGSAVWAERTETEKVELAQRVKQIDRIREAYQP